LVEVTEANKAPQRTDSSTLFTNTHGQDSVGMFREDMSKKMIEFVRYDTGIANIAKAIPTE
jgi:hypothetical protein